MKFIAKKILSSRSVSIDQTEIHPALKMRVQHTILVEITVVVVVVGEALLAELPLALLGDLSPLVGVVGVHPLATAEGLPALDATAPVPQDSIGDLQVHGLDDPSVPKAVPECGGQPAPEEECPQP